MAESSPMDHPISTEPQGACYYCYKLHVIRLHILLEGLNNGHKILMLYVSFLNLPPHKLQASLLVPHPNNICPVVSVTSPQRGQRWSPVIFLLKRLALVESAFNDACHINIFRKTLYKFFFIFSYFIKIFILKKNYFN
jgi:hypothetical protein